VITEIIAVRPVLKSLEQHLYVLSTLALALMIQQVTAIEWSTEPQGFPRLIGLGSAFGTKKFWLPVPAVALVMNRSRIALSAYAGRARVPRHR